MRIQIYQVYDSSDPAGSDFFTAFIGNAEGHIKNIYGIRPKITFDEKGNWEQDVGHMTIYVQRHDIRNSATAIANALSVLPNR